MVQSDESGRDGNRRRLGTGATASLAGGGLLLIFIIQNTEQIRLHFLVWNFSWPLWLYTVVVAVFTKDVAETKATNATDAGRRKGYPLLFSTEPEE